MDLRDLFRDEWPLTPRYVLSLILHLPLGSAYNAERRGGPQFRDWDEGRYATVAMVNALRAIQYMYLASHLDPKKHRIPDPPEPFPTPENRRRPAGPPKPGSFRAIAGSMIAATRKKKEGLHERSRGD